jgi:serine/threonine protein kinase
VNVSPGTRLGPYEVVAPIGAGGMGEVFKARDTRLERSVAIKVLPAEPSQNAQLRMRFEREAKAISQLSHPNICTLYDVGDGYLVMELLDGETLADRLKKGPLPLDQGGSKGVKASVVCADIPSPPSVDGTLPEFPFRGDLACVQRIVCASPRTFASPEVASVRGTSSST